MEFKTEKSVKDFAPQEIHKMNYDNFMVFELEDTGERTRLNITEDKFRETKGAGILHSKQVVLIVKEDIRRIYIWKGIEPPVRKKFIASRVAQELQGEMIKRCKIVTVDQGDELNEFLNVFGFKKDELAKVSGFTGEILDQSIPKITRQAPTSSPIIPKSPRFTKNGRSKVKSQETRKIDRNVSKEVLEKVLKLEPPENYKRKNILTGQNTLYGLITKKVKVFGKDLEELEWEPIENLPKGVFELEGHKIRIHHEENNKVNAIEILQPIEKIKKQESISLSNFQFENWTVKALKEFCSENNIKVPSSYRKAQIIELVENYTSK